MGVGTALPTMCAAGVQLVQLEANSIPARMADAGAGGPETDRDTPCEVSGSGVYCSGGSVAGSGDCNDAVRPAVTGGTTPAPTIMAPIGVQVGAAPATATGAKTGALGDSDRGDGGGDGPANCGGAIEGIVAAPAAPGDRLRAGPPRR